MSYCQFATEPMPKATRRDILADGKGCWDTAIVMSSFRIDCIGRMIVGGTGSCDAPGGSIHHAWARRKLRKLFPASGDLKFEHAWSGTIAVTADHVPKIVEFGPNAYACFGYSGRGIGPGQFLAPRLRLPSLNEGPKSCQSFPSGIIQNISRALRLYITRWEQP